ncbi:hypothetical protein ACQKEY_22365 [Lysinibacillus fusiformis]|uniref:hypothetical protein n=1 Tax=Lysinibacillus fusiformis TaxID=28031 RepID=UPI002E22CB95|nr:hypothetical protein [Lysinibacillus fusiformis]
MMGVSGLFTWVQEQAQYILFIAVIILSLVMAFKRQWIGLVGTLAGLAIIGLFVIQPEMIKTVGTTIGGWLGL